ncbi:MAG: nucleotide exchange factor GrpE [Calditrichaeota bacterium]|nr:nucleotide exchange factor GrpE [Calditrichota bacterium]
MVKLDDNPRAKEVIEVPIDFVDEEVREDRPSVTSDLEENPVGDDATKQENAPGEQQPTTEAAEETEEQPVAEEAAEKEAKEAEEERVKELEDRLLRLMAEFDNFRRRTREQQAQIAVDSKAELVKKLLPVIDDFGHMMEHADADADAVAEGARLIYKKLVDILTSEGLEPLASVGDPFDPEVHEAVAVQPVDDPEKDHKVLAVTKQGYRFKGRVIRPAQVVVGQLSSEE